MMGPQTVTYDDADSISSIHGEGRWDRNRRPAFTIAAIVLALYPLAAGVLLLTRNGWAVNRANVWVWMHTLGPGGLRLPITPEQFADLANVVLFIPPFAALALLVPTWWWVLLGTAISGGIEYAQHVRGGRDATVVDVITNTAGAALGVGLGLWIRYRLSADAPSASDAAPRAPVGPTTHDAAQPATAHDPAVGEDDRR